MTEEPKEKLLIDIHELSALIGIKASSLYHWASQGRLPCTRLGARCLRFSLPAIRQWLETLSKPATGDESIEKCVVGASIQRKKGESK